MRADPSDRIISVEGPEISPVSVPRIFLVGLMLPFAHPVRLVLASIVPAVLIVVFGVGPTERVMAVWQALGIGQPSGLVTTTTTAPPALPAGFGADVAQVEGIVFLALTIWLCAWQRGAARDFTEPIPRWLGRSLMRLPGYIIAFAVWLLAPVVVLLIPSGAMMGLIALNIGLGQAALAGPDRRRNGDDPGHAQRSAMVGRRDRPGDHHPDRVMAQCAALAPCRRWWQARGWRHAVGRAWQLSRGHGFGLSVSLVSYTLLALLVLFIASVVLGIAMYARARAGGAFDAGTGLAFGAAINLVVTALIAVWQASLGALVVRDGLSPAEALDPAMFD